LVKKLLKFAIYILFVLLIIHYIQGINIRYGIEFGRKILVFDKNKNGSEILLPEYNGSYHVTFTLPYTDKTTNKEFINMHQNFANQLQWLEPLMLAAYVSGDEYAPGSIKNRVRGSFSVMIIGWVNFAGSDVRLFNKGIGRYAKTPTYWRKNLNFLSHQGQTH
jgi:hypothetical protein